MKAIEIFDMGVARGLTFRLVANDEIEVTGPTNVINDLEDAIAVHCADLISIVQEFTSPSDSAENILLQFRAQAKPSRRKPKTTKAIGQKAAQQQFPSI